MQLTGLTARRVFFDFLLPLVLSLTAATTPCKGSLDASNSCDNAILR